MSKIGLIIEREYFTRVKKKSFLVMTILVPLLMVGFYAAILAVSLTDSADKQKIAIIDDGNIIRDELNSFKDEDIQFAKVNNETEKSFISKYKAAGYSAFVYIPKQNVDSNGTYKLHNTSSTSMSTTSRVEDLIDEALVNRRLEARGMDPKTYRSISSKANVETTIDTKDGEKKSEVFISMIISVACGTLIYLMMIIYGAQVMRGVSEEKTNRIAEVVVSSVKPFQLMMGKILGIGAVGLTQFLIWLVLIVLGQFMIPLFMPDAMNTVSATAQAGNPNIMATVASGIASLPIAKIIGCFMFYFLGGYLTYASLFAAVGSVVSEDQQEAQQMMMPILMPIILGFVIMVKAVNEPNSSLAVFGSIFPLTSPVVMMGRITYDIPVWQIAVSMLALILCFLGFTWVTAKIYRTGILMYGKKPTWKEMIKWGFRKG